MSLYPENFPERLQSAIEEVLRNYPNHCYHPPKELEHSAFVTNQLLYITGDGYKVGNLTAAWARVEGGDIDLTARRSNQGAPCPKILKHGNTN